jgi:class 3 adenylate cyclase
METKSVVGFRTNLVQGLGEVTKVSNAVVGVVDIVASTRISNHVELEIDWEIRKIFFMAARQRAKENGVELVNHTGDGFLFLIDRDQVADWSKRILKFHATLTRDFRNLLTSMHDHLDGIESGLRFGLSAGPVMLGRVTSDLDELHIVGADVNMAARLCMVGRINELVLSSRVWQLLKTFLNDKNTRTQTHTSLKGFDTDVPALHLNFREIVELPGCELNMPPSRTTPVVGFQVCSRVNRVLKWYISPLPLAPPNTKRVA